jgi:hypothetical protein
VEQLPFVDKYPRLLKKGSKWDFSGGCSPKYFRWTVHICVYNLISSIPIGNYLMVIAIFGATKTPEPDFIQINSLHNIPKKKYCI